MFPQNCQISLLGSAGKMVFSCLKHYSNLLLNFPKYNCKVCIHTFLQKTTRNSNKHYTKSPTASTIIISIHALPSSPFWHKFQKWMEATSIYTKLPNYYVTKEITTSSQFRQGVTKTSNRLSYLPSQLQCSLRELTTHFHNLSVYRKFIEQCLTTPDEERRRTVCPFCEVLV